MKHSLGQFGFGMNVLGCYNDWTASIARAVLSWFRKRRGVPCKVEAPVLGRYREEALNTPNTAERTPDPKYFDKPVAYYAEMHHAAVSLYEATPRAAQGDIELIYSCQVHAQWGLIHAGADATPYAVKMLDSRVPEEREDGAAILAAIGRNEQALDALLRAFDREYERNVGATAAGASLQALDSMITALGQMKNGRAIPALAKVIRNASTDKDTRWTAVESLGRLARRRFDKDPDPVRSAIQWLEQHQF